MKFYPARISNALLLLVTISITGQYSAYGQSAGSFSTLSTTGDAEIGGALTIDNHGLADESLALNVRGSISAYGRLRIGTDEMLNTLFDPGVEMYTGFGKGKVLYNDSYYDFGSTNELRRRQRFILSTGFEFGEIYSSWDWAIQDGTNDESLQMNLGSGELTVYAGSGQSLEQGAPLVHSIRLNANEPAIYLDATKVLTEANGYTQTQADGRYLPLHPLNLSIAGGVVSASGSMAVGSSATATGENSIVLGTGSAAGSSAVSIGFTNSINSSNFAIGEHNEAYGSSTYSYGNTNYFGAAAYNTIAIGVGNQVSYDGSASWGCIVLGNGNQLSAGYNSAAVGMSNLVNGQDAFAFGEQNIVPSATACAVGRSNEVYGEVSFAAGQFCKTHAFYTTAVGYGVETSQNYQMVVGTYNDPTLDTDARFVIGIGDWGVGKNGFMVYTTGKAVATGNVESRANTGYNKFKAPILVPESGDISMGEFTAGEQP